MWQAMAQTKPMAAVAGEAGAAVVLLLAVILPFVLPPFWVGKITGWIPLALAALGLNLLTGYNGQISVGHGALFGIGAVDISALRWSPNCFSC